MKANISKKLKCLICNQRYSVGKLMLIKEYARWNHKPSKFKFTSSKVMVCNSCFTKHEDLIKQL